MKDVNDFQPSTSTDTNHGKNENKSRKRRASNSAEGDVQAKRFIAQEDDDGSFKLLDFTDEVLLEILQNCDTHTLYALSKTCTQFLKLVKDRSLWKTFDLSTKKMMGRQIKKLLSTMQIGDIKEFKVRGFVSTYPLEKWKNNTITPNILRKLSSSCPSLETMELRESHINFDQVKISDFPSTLKRLIFHGCQIPLPRPPSLFQKIDNHLQLLEEISLEKCPWFETHDLVVFSKLPHLKRLILRGCESLKECVPYGSIAARFGFKSLEYLDVRDTPISDSDIQCFNVTSTLREILMDCPVGLRFDSESSTVEMSDNDDDDDDEEEEEEEVVDDNETYDTKSKEAAKPAYLSDTNSETESESDDESDCSSDSEDGDNDAEATKTSGNNEETVGTPQAHCIQVILQNGRMINVNAERSNEHDNTAQMRGPNVRCVIGIINGRDAGHSRYNRIIAAPLKQSKPGCNDASNAQTAKATDSTSNSQSSNKSPKRSESSSSDTNTTNGNTEAANKSTNAESDSQPGPSGLQTNQNDSTNASKSNSERISENIEQVNANANANDEAGPSNRNAANAPNAPNVEHRQRLIIVQHRHHNNNDENGNMNRRISWEVRNVYPIGDASNRNERLPTSLFSSNGYYITDRGMCSFGMPRRNVQEGIIWIRAELRPPDTLLERITVRNYVDVTDVTLRHLALCAPNLRYLDVSGTSVTLKGITTFLKEKPECEVVSELLEK